MLTSKEKLKSYLQVSKKNNSSGYTQKEMIIK